LTKPLPDKLRAALAECGMHSQVLADAAALLPMRFNSSDIAGITPELRRVLDQAAYRYMKLQDSLGERVLPGLLDVAQEPLPPEAPFAQKLQRLERLGVIPSADTWRLLREVRNALAHEYPDDPTLQAAALTRFRRAVDELLGLWQVVAASAARSSAAP
jgi:hypothetical protein